MRSDIFLSIYKTTDKNKVPVLFINCSTILGLMLFAVISTSASYISQIHSFVTEPNK